MSRWVLFLLLTAAVPVRADEAVELFSIAGSSLSPAEVGDLIESQGGRLVAVGDRLVDETETQKAGRDVPLTKEQGDALLAARVKVRLARLRADAREGRVTPSERAEARALAVLRAGALSFGDRYFLDSLNPETADADPLLHPVGAVPEPDPPSDRDELSAAMRRLVLFDDHGDPAQREALDAAFRLMMRSPTARALSAEFVAQGRRAKVSFETLDGGAVGEDKHKWLAGIGAVTERSSEDRIKINRGYLETPESTQFGDLPGTLAHELLGHALNGARAAAAGVGSAIDKWDGDEDLAGVTGWLVQAEIDGKARNDSYLWSYLSDPARYRRTRQLITVYYAESYSPDEANRLPEAYAERLERAQERIAFLEKRFAPRIDWVKAIDHFESPAHGIDPRRLASDRIDAEFASTAAARGELSRLDSIRDALASDLKTIREPYQRSRQADVAREMADPFFADAQRRLATMTDKLRAIATKNPPPAPTPARPDEIGWPELFKMYDDDLRDHPDHWAVAASTAAPSAPPLAPAK